MVSKDNKKKIKNTMSDTDCQLDFEYLAEYSLNNDNYAIQVGPTEMNNVNDDLVFRNIKKTDKANKKKLKEKKVIEPEENKLLRKLMNQYQIMSRYEQQEWQSGNLMVAGLDEVGRGPLAGPVVAAACILDPNDPILGLNDSKKLSEKKRDELFVEIQKRAICYSIVRIEHDIIDEINILNATKMAMVECVRILVQKPDKLLIDAIDLKGTGIPVIPIIKGDSLSVSIAAASILAKVTRDRLMVEYDEAYPGYGFSQNKGYGTALHYEGIKQQGITPIHRKTFLKGWI